MGGLAQWKNSLEMQKPGHQQHTACRNRAASDPALHQRDLFSQFQSQTAVLHKLKAKVLDLVKIILFVNV